MSDKLVELKELDSFVYQLEIQRPKALNALNLAVLQQIESALGEVLEKNNCRCLVVRGCGEKAFVAGADIKEIAELDKTSAQEFAKKGQAVFRKLEQMPFATIAMVRGFALGGGFELALSCDFIVASKSATFGLPESNLGLIPGFGGTVRLARRVGQALAKEVAFRGDFFKAEQVAKWGLISDVVEDENLEEATLKIAKTIASRSPLAIDKIKKSVDKGYDQQVDEAYITEAQLFSELFGSADQKEGVQAFIEKRQPDFTGN